MIYDDVEEMEYEEDEIDDGMDLEERLEFLMRKADLEEAVRSWSY